MRYRSSGPGIFAGLDPTTILVAEFGVFIIAFMRGAFGGGFAIIGIPLLSLAMDPIAAGAVLAPTFVAMDLAALRYWKPSTWSKPDVAVLAPAMVVGIALGLAVMALLDHRLVAVVIALVTLGFAGLWFMGGGRIEPRPRSTPKAALAGLASGVTTMIAHSGGPPLALYLLPLGLAKEVYAGTTSLCFTVANAVKVWPWLMLRDPTPDYWTTVLLVLPAVPIGVFAGWHLHKRLDQLQLYRACYALLVVTALKLLWDGIFG